MTDKDLITLNDRLADVLVYIKGYKVACQSMSGGNKEVKQAQLDLCNWIESNLTASKKLLSREISQ